MPHCTTHILALFSFLFFFTDTPTTDIYTLSLHDALPISGSNPLPNPGSVPGVALGAPIGGRFFLSGAPVPVSTTNAAGQLIDRKSTRLNSSHTVISYAVFCLKKKKKKE